MRASLKSEKSWTVVPDTESDLDHASAEMAKWIYLASFFPSNSWLMLQVEMTKLLMMLMNPRQLLVLSVYP